MHAIVVAILWRKSVAIGKFLAKVSLCYVVDLHLYSDPIINR